MNVVVRRIFEIKNRLGLHARAAVQVVQVASQFDADVSISKDGQVVDGKSILGIMMLAAAQGNRVEVIAQGRQAGEAVDAIGDLIDRCFDEDD